MLIGSIDGYREKVYGTDDPDINVSPGEFEGTHKIWDLRHTYKVLWREFHHTIIDHAVNQRLLHNLSDSFDMTFSSIPAPALCEYQDIPGEIAVREHEFNYQNVWIDSLWYGPGLDDDPFKFGDYQNLVICNGKKIYVGNKAQTGWYRTSLIYGNANTEWSSQAAIPDRINVPGKIFNVRKPINTTCNCWPSIVRAGRYGKWTKGVLTHHAFQEAMDILA